MSVISSRDNLGKSGIEQILPADPDGRSLPGERKPWRRLGLYYSNIAFSVLLEPDGDCDRRHAKTRLYRYLKRIHLILLESGLIYPLVAIVLAKEGTTMHTELRRWASDQDWHRGDFTLYVESDLEAGRRRLIDLLSLKVPKLMDERRAVRSIQDYMEDLERGLPEAGVQHELGQIILDVWRERELSATASEATNNIDRWVIQRIDEARRVASGEQV